MSQQAQNAQGQRPAQSAQQAELARREQVEMREEAKGMKADALGALRPGNLAEAMRLAEILSDSSFVPKDFIGKPGNVLAALMMGAEVGLAPLASLQGIAVINGRPSLWGDALLGVCRAHPEWGGMEETIDDQRATCVVTRVERIGGRLVPSKYPSEFSREDAKQAKLLEKDGPWKQYTKRMLKLRARAFALRDAFADVLKGLSSAEEMSDVIDVVARDITPREAAAEAAAAAVAPSVEVTVDEPNFKKVGAPVSGAAALREKLSARNAASAPTNKTPSTPPSSLNTERIQAFLDAYRDVDVVDDLAAIKRDLAPVWGTWTEAEQAAVTAAAEAAKQRLQQST